MINNIEFTSNNVEINNILKDLKIDENKVILSKTIDIIKKYVTLLDNLRSNVIILNKNVLRISSKPQYGPEDINKKFPIVQETQCLPELEKINELITSWKRYLNEKDYFFNNIYLQLNWYFPNIFEDYNLILNFERDVIIMSNIIYSLNIRLIEYKKFNYKMF